MRKLSYNHSLAESQLPFYLRCLKSLMAFCQDRIELQLLSDGSLSQEDKDFIHSELMERWLPLPTPLKTPVVCWITCKADQTAKRLERILFGELSSLTPFSHSPKIPISFYLDADILFHSPILRII